ncbi:hypothetical protein OB236_34715 [Paenibacillus sp. WQ 127069]|uniref:Uncharacterized protein n=1 Tax=Paenibacillus baimaensis TaxID=2982185 RepID=A0ABT2URM7_9BACL|nr:hypothetical protein [Paenibacillus sp. WQ 127069]
MCKAFVFSGRLSSLRDTLGMVLHRGGQGLCVLGALVVPAGHAWFGAVQ